MSFTIAWPSHPSFSFQWWTKLLSLIGPKFCCWKRGFLTWCIFLIHLSFSLVNTESYNQSWPKITRQFWQLFQTPPTPITMLDRHDSTVHVPLFFKSHHWIRGGRGKYICRDVFWPGLYDKTSWKITESK